MTTRQEVVQYMIGQCEKLKGLSKSAEIEKVVKEEIDYKIVVEYLTKNNREISEEKTKSRYLIKGNYLMLKEEEFKGNEREMLCLIWGLNKSKKTRTLPDYKDAEIIADLQVFIDTLISEHKINEEVIRNKQICEISSLEEILK